MLRLLSKHSKRFSLLMQNWNEGSIGSVLYIKFTVSSLNPINALHCSIALSRCGTCITDRKCSYVKSQGIPHLTQLTQSLWPSSWMVYLHWARVFHSLMLLSRLADTICLLSAEKATDITSLVWSSNLRVVFPVLRSHRRRFLSQEPDSAKCPSEDRTTSDTKCLEWKTHFEELDYLVACLT